MDFVILKVNGQDLSSSSHERVLEVFKAAKEPIIVEVARRNPYKPQMSETNDSVSPYATSLICAAADTYASYGIKGNSPSEGSSESQVNAEDELEPDEDYEEFIKQEIVLRKRYPRDIFGLTLSYSAMSASDNSESEVYISAIEPNSVASIEPNIRIGDQILQINDIDVHSKAQVVSMFHSCGLEVKLLLGRPKAMSVKNGFRKSISYDCELPPLEEAEYASVYEETEAAANPATCTTQLDKDSGFSRSTDDPVRTEESSECDSAPSSLNKSESVHSADNSPADRPNPMQIAQMMQHLALEYQQLQKLLTGFVDMSIQKIQALPPPTLTPISSRIVPRMGTKLDPPMMKLANGSVTTSGSNTSAYSTGADSTRSSPLTMEIGQAINSNSTLSLKLDLFSNSNPTAIKTTDDLFYKSCSRAGPRGQNVLEQRHMNGTLPSREAAEHKMAVSTIIPTESENHYYDVYDPSTKGATDGCRGLFGDDSENVDGRRLAEPEYVNTILLEANRMENKMEWVVKKRPDGTRYITRRPIRNKFLKERAKKVHDERSGFTTEEDDLHGDCKLTRGCWKSEKRRSFDKPKERRSKPRDSSAILLPLDAVSNSPTNVRGEVSVKNKHAARDLSQKTNCRDPSAICVIGSSTMF